jgi:AcrR family transcriptional regulator
VSSPASSARGRLRAASLPAPKPLLDAAAEQRLSARQLELLDELESGVRSRELARLTMAEIAARMGCSLRTLYGIAPSKDELILLVVDRRLHRIGRNAIEALDESRSPLASLRAYLHAANRAVRPESVAFSEALGHVPGAQPLLDAHERYVVAVAKSLLDRALAAGEIRAVDTAAFAHVLGGLGRELSRPGVAELAAAPPDVTADAITEVILRGLGVEER